VFYEMLRAFTQMRGLWVGLLKCDHDSPSALTDDERAGVGLLTELGVEVLEPFQFPETGPVRNGYARMLAPRLEDHYPCARHARSLESVVKRFGADVVLIPWSEWLTGACADIDVPKFAYYGNPDTKSWNARLRFQWANGAIGVARFGVETLLSHHLERAHLRQAKKYQWFGNVAHNDASYYQQHGHKNAFYIQNIWVDRGLYAGSHALAKQGNGRGTVARIIANVGKLGGTANTLGLHYLGNRLLPELQRTLSDIPYEIHILGAGEPHSAVASRLAVPEVFWRGFVDDIDAELRAAAVFLCVNNATDFKVGHTRYLHAWSLGACVVAHRDAALSMPEIRHDENALLGETPDEIAYWVAEAARNESLRRRIGDGGYETFRSCFTAERVTAGIVERIRAGYQ
jgi:glycosyltransferase involved in cell wall biosynthesis